MIREVINSTAIRTISIGVAFWILVLTCVGSIRGSHGIPARTFGEISSLSLSVRPPSPRALAESSTTNLPEVVPQALSAWQGPIQPVRLQPSKEAPIILRIPTTEPVIFVGIDDGWIQTPENLDWLVSHHLPFTLFLTNNGIKNNYNYFEKLQDAGMTVEDHTLSHGDLTKMTAAQQKKEICHTADIYQKVFGQRPTLFRPPYGAYNDDTRKIAAACGLKAIVMWHVVVGADKTGDEQFQSSNHLQPGDIVLMHFKSDFLEDMQALAKDAARNHLQIGRLEDWLP